MADPPFPAVPPPATEPLRKAGQASAGDGRLAEQDPRRHAVRRMATALLALMALIYAITTWAERAYGWTALGYLRAFAEAAMVGGLADWFAVTALFRHPLGLPIPHTAIIPRNKDRIGAALATFLRANFLTPAVIARRMRRIDIAGTLGRFLKTPSRPEAGSDRVAPESLARLMSVLIGALDDERLGGLVKSGLHARLSEIQAAPLMGRMLGAALIDGRHQPLVDTAIRWADRTLEANQPLLRDMIKARANSLLRWTGLDERLANKILDGFTDLLAEVAANSDHPLRARLEEGLAHFAIALQDDPATQARINRLRDELLRSPELMHWLDGVWTQARTALLRASRDPQQALAGRLGEIARHLGDTMLNDRVLATTLNRSVRRLIVGVAARYGDAIVRLVSDTIQGWDATTVTQRLENAVGRDLQYIRVNGTLVGGLVGLGLHALDRLTG